MRSSGCRWDLSCCFWWSQIDTVGTLIPPCDPSVFIQVFSWSTFDCSACIVEEHSKANLHLVQKSRHFLPRLHQVLFCWSVGLLYLLSLFFWTTSPRCGHKKTNGSFLFLFFPSPSECRDWTISGKRLCWMGDTFSKFKTTAHSQPWCLSPCARSNAMSTFSWFVPIMMMEMKTCACGFHSFVCASLSRYFLSFQASQPFTPKYNTIRPGASGEWTIFGVRFGAGTEAKSFKISRHYSPNSNFHSVCRTRYQYRIHIWNWMRAYEGGSRSLRTTVTQHIQDGFLFF